MKPLNVAIVGCGRISELHELGYRGRKDARIAAVCDVRERSAREKAKAWNVAKIYTDYHDVLADTKIDLVELIVPHHLHASMTMEACAAGKHVSVQKPMALSVSDATNMIRAADQVGVVLRVYENYIFYPPFVQAKKMIDAGDIGEPQMIRMHFNDAQPERGWKVDRSSIEWRLDENRSGGGPFVFDHGSHMFALSRYLLGEVERVYAWIDHQRNPLGGTLDAPATIMFQFKSPHRYGVMDFSHTPNMHIDSSYYTADERLEVIGDKGIVFVNRCDARSVDLPEVMLFRDGKTTAIPVQRVEWHESFIDCTRHLLDVIHNGGKPMLDGKEGRAVLQFALAAHLSAREKTEVRPDEVT